MRALTAILLAAALGCVLLRGALGGLGFALAVVGAGVNLWAWWAIARTSGSAAREGAKPRLGTVLVVLTFLVKLPAFVALFILAKRFGPEATGCFIFGTVLVYSSATTWLALRG